MTKIDHELIGSRVVFKASAGPLAGLNTADKHLIGFGFVEHTVWFEGQGNAKEPPSRRDR